MPGDRSLYPVAFCWACWRARYPAIVPAIIKPHGVERCVGCDISTESGIRLTIEQEQRLEEKR